MVGAVGGGNCRVEGTSITTLTPSPIMLTECHLRLASTYQVAVYIEDSNNRTDGSLYFLKTVTQPGFSNGFVVMPMVDGNVTVVTLQFTAMQPMGKAWINIIPFSLASLALRTIRSSRSTLLLSCTCSATPMSVMSEQNSMGADGCRLSDVMIDGTAKEFALEYCSLAYLADYALMVYVAGAAGHDDGILAVARFVTPSSNQFELDPSVASGITTNGASISLTSTVPGKLWAFIAAQMWALGGTACRHIGVPATAQLQTLSLSGCSLTHSQTYHAFVYVEDDSGLGDGTLSEPIDFPVPGSSIFVTNPSVFGTPTQTTVAISFESPTLLAGLVWALVGTQEDMAKLDSVSIKVGIGAICRINGQAISSGAHTESISGCTLARGTEYALRVYIEAGGLPGTMSTPTPVLVPTSNGFAEAPTASSPTQTSVDLSFRTLGAGRSWGVVVASADVGLVKVTTIKAGTGAINGVCKVTDQAVPNTNVNMMSFSSCNFVMGTTHKAFLYVEDGNGLGDGMLSGPVDVVLPPSNTFDVAPFEERTPTADGAAVTLTPALNGNLWAMITSDITAKTLAEIQAGTNAMGGASCLAVNVAVTGGISYTHAFSSCSLTAGNTYTAHFYVED
ncbi:unnamed protein product [Polarella glacialis]|uniref:Uncharacterized protein n=1 Tax=Polarella glacialis TaxID=89957 RepID=A0A813D586_POLGL|nr:unnamed protein product [Polarella glacialis]